MVGLFLDPLRRAGHRHWWAALLMAAAGTGLALAIRLALGSVIERTPYFTFFPAIVLTTYLGGRIAGWLSLVGAFALVWFFSGIPFASFFAPTPSGFGISLLRALIGLGIIEIIERLNIGLDRAEKRLSEKEVLFLELRHRISNNLQIVTGLLRLQARSLSDNQARRALEETSDRLMALSRIHKDLRTPEATTIDFAAFIRDLAKSLSDVSGIAIATEFDTSGEWDADFVIKLSMVAQELISNAIEHGISGVKGGKVSVELHVRPEGDGQLTIKDDGVGLPAGFDYRSTGGFGMKIVDLLLQQIGGELALTATPAGGTEALVTFTPPLRR
jgi:two-component sensor histidine kinase